MTSTDWLELVARYLPAAFVADLLAFTFATWWLARWREVRAKR